jgi:hypothetical protein
MVKAAHFCVGPMKDVGAQPLCVCGYQTQQIMISKSTDHDIIKVNRSPKLTDHHIKVADEGCAQPLCVCVNQTQQIKISYQSQQIIKANISSYQSGR